MTALSPTTRQPWHCTLPCWPTPGFLWAAQRLLVTIFPSSSSPGDIGGQMGLFIGASILTILEILDYIYEVCLAFRDVSRQWVQRQASWGGHKMCGHSGGLLQPQIGEHPEEGSGRRKGPPALLSDLRTVRVVGRGTVPLSLGEQRSGQQFRVDRGVHAQGATCVQVWV